MSDDKPNTNEQQPDIAMSQELSAQESPVYLVEDDFGLFRISTKGDYNFWNFTVPGVKKTLIAGTQPTAQPANLQDEFDLRGMLASKLTCWHRLTEAEASELVALVAGLSQPAPVQVPLMVDIHPPATQRDRWMYEQGRLAERDPRSHTTPPAQPAPVQEQALPEFFAALEYNSPDWDVFACVYRRRADATPELVHREQLPLQAPAAQPAAPDFKDFMAWANDAGYDTAYTHDGIKWICLNPMTADLWKAWQAATPPAAQPASVQERMLVDPAEYDDYGAAVQRNKVIGAAHKVGGAT